MKNKNFLANVPKWWLRNFFQREAMTFDWLKFTWDLKGWNTKIEKVHWWSRDWLRRQMCVPSTERGSLAERKQLAGRAWRSYRELSYPSIFPSIQQILQRKENLIEIFTLDTFAEMDYYFAVIEAIREKSSSLACGKFGFKENKWTTALEVIVNFRYICGNGKSTDMPKLMRRAWHIANPTLSLPGQIEFREDCVTLSPCYFHFGQLSANNIAVVRRIYGSFIVTWWWLGKKKLQQCVNDLLREREENQIRHAYCMWIK